MGDTKASSFNLRDIDFAGQAETKLQLIPHALPGFLTPFLLCSASLSQALLLGNLTRQDEVRA